MTRHLARGAGGGLLALVLSGGGTWASEPAFDAASVPAALAKDAGAVVRLQEHAFAVEGPGRAVERVRRVATVLNQNGREFGRVAVFYDRFRRVEALRGWLLDGRGQKVRDLKGGDIQDLSAISGYSLYEDHRVRVAELYHDVYPYTVVLEYSLSHDGLIGWPAWYPQDYRAPVERTTFEISAPSDAPVRYRTRGALKGPQVQRAGRRQVLRWEETALPKGELEPDGPPWSEQAPSLLTAPSEFEIDGYAGDMSSWGSFGRWYHHLTVGRSDLPAPAREQVRGLCETAGTPLEKARRLYERLQETTRYVSVQLGIGAWRPFDAAYVCQRGYGDCKALTNYMLAMLQTAGVEAYPALIRRGFNAPDAIPDFPSHQFNHVVLFVPLGADTLWLECTSQTIPFGRLGADNEDRNALVVTPEGGRLVRTPRSRSTDNQQVRRATVALSGMGDGRAEVRALYTGNQQDRVRQALALRSPRDREDWLREEVEVPAFRLTGADFSDVEGRRPEVTLSYAMELPRLASRAGARLFLCPNLMERETRVPPEVKARTQPVDLGYARLDVDSVSYRLPPHIAVEAAPPDVHLETPFGRYAASAAIHDSTLDYVRRLEILVPLLPAHDYDAYRAFFIEVAKADQRQIVFVTQN